MSDAASLTLSLPRNRRFAGAASSSEHALDLTAVYRFSFIRERWLTGAGKIVQSILMMATGGFLFTQISSTPNLRVQMTIIAGLMCAGGVYLLSRVGGDILGGLIVDCHGLRASFVSSHWASDWSEVKRWKINETAATISDLACVEVWTAKSASPLTIPGGHLSEKDLHLLRQLFFIFAKEQEDT